MARLNLIVSALVTALAGLTVLACGGQDNNSTPPPNSSVGGRTGSSNNGGSTSTSPGNSIGGNGYVVSSGTGGSSSCADTSKCKAQAAEGCGDGINNQGGIEACDDGNTVPGDGCNGACKVERNWQCPADISIGPCKRLVICGDGVIGAGEVCDDGNTTDGDGCNSTCTVQDAAYTCLVPGQACQRVTVCGNSRRETGETCDDGNDKANDGCSATCQTEAGWVCPKPGTACKPAPNCGDGVVNSTLGEVCDDGNTIDGDGCSANCKTKGVGCVCSPGIACKCPKIACGDGIVEGAEACDDGNTNSGDGCKSDCSSVETGYSCPFSGAPCVPKCGDGIVMAPMEQCDPGVQATNMDKACTSTCKWADGWACSGTPVTCHATKCGDSKVEGTEGCDDGNTTPGDGCSPTCHVEPKCDSAVGTCTSICGDGIVMPAQPDGPVMPGGSCDDGNAVSGDGCSADCKVEAGYQCEQPPQTSPTMTVPMVARDFNAGGDFEPTALNKNAAVTGLVKSKLDGDGKPESSGVLGGNGYITSTDSYSHWYRDGSWVNYTNKTTLTLYDNGNGGYVNRYGANGEKWQTLSGDTQHWCGTTAQPDHDAAGKAIPCTFCPYDADTSTPQCDAMVNGVAVQQPQSTDCQTIPNMLSCVTGTDGTYHGIWLEAAYDGNPAFFPVDGAPTKSPTSAATIPPPYSTWTDEPGKPIHNFSFTTEVRYWFGYVASKKYTLDFMGDDDVWVFINRNLAVDLGGIHTPVGGTLVLDGTANSSLTITQTDKCTTVNGGATTCPPTSTKKITPADLGLADGGVYEIALFQAERQTTASTYKLTISGFNDQPSQCKAICGDGVVSPGEQCDNGTALNLGGYNQCTDQCLLGPYCGDGVINGTEACDDGKNDTDRGAANGCSPGCKLPSSCGDGLVQTEWGEECDLGDGNVAPNADGSAAYGTGICTTTCLSGGYCGDGNLNGPETCDDGVNDGSYEACNPDCTPAPKCGDLHVDEEYGEECDSDDVTLCSGCRIPGGCGDGIVQKAQGEQCDLGALDNTGAYGGCTPGCLFAPNCGDGIVNGNETCDDGILDNSYGGCTPQCKRAAYCGDGNIDAAGKEECDNGTKNGTDGLCTPSCKAIIYVPS